MQFLTTTNVYGPGDHSNEAFLELVKMPPDGIIILDGNAGLGADWPAGIWKSLNGMAVALAILSAPSTIEENWPKWKEIFDYVSQQIIDFHGEFRVDRDSAQVIAMHHAVTNFGIEPSRLSVHMAIRHFFTKQRRKTALDAGVPGTEHIRAARIQPHGVELVDASPPVLKAA